MQQQHRPHHLKRPHKKSRNGCQNCKSRKVKCDEVRPTCGLCGYRQLECLYPSKRPISAISQTRYEIHEASTPAPQLLGVIPVLPSNILGPDGDSQAKLLWFYNHTTYTSFSIDRSDNAAVEHTTRKVLLDLAIKNPFLMSSILALTNVHIEAIFQKRGETPPARYLEQNLLGHEVAFEGFTTGIASALLANSLVLVALSSRVFLQHGCNLLCLGEWMSMWMKIRQVVEIITVPGINMTGLSALFRRPYVELESAAAFTPNALLFMISSIEENDIDYGEVHTYHETSKYIGSLCKELRHGYSPVLMLRIITWLTYVPPRFVQLVQELRPRALVIAAHYLAFLKLVRTVWWLDDVGRLSLHNICLLLGPDWVQLLEMPTNVSQAHTVDDVTEALLSHD